MSKTAFECSECSKATVRLHPILNVPLCAKCQRSKPEKYRYVAKTRAMEQYRLGKKDLAHLGMYEVDNPHYKIAAPMQLYMLTQVEELARAKWGSIEPYMVQLVTFSEEVLQAFLEDTERLKLLTDDEFERMVAEFLAARGYGVKRVGDVRRKDGGVDIVAWPEKGCVFPFLMAVQAKHHRTNRKTGVSAVRDFHGVVTSRGSQFQLGVIVTNTAFTADAKWFASHNQTLLRLRDLADLRRWIRNDFNNPCEWREIPGQIELAPGVSVTIPKKKLWLPH
jgi:restriction endonuclease Mrr